MDVVASSITIGALAVNVANSVVKLKNCWDSIQDAPEDIQFLIERVEILSQILRDVEEDQTQNSMSSMLLDESTASKCLKTCKAAADRLRQLTERMATSIDTSRRLKRKWISAKVVLKKDKILKFEKELQSCISLLQLSHEMYTRSLIRLQPEIIYAKVVQAVSSGTFPTPNTVPNHQINGAVAGTSSLVTNSRSQSSELQSYQSFWQSTSALDILGCLHLRTRYSKKRKLIGTDDVGNTEVHKELTARYRLPRWLANQVWDFCAKKSYSGWDFQLRQYVIISTSSPEFQYALSGNVRGLQELFSKREASPWSCNNEGWTLLHAAFIRYDVPVCRLLLDLGADLNYQNKYGSSALKVLVRTISRAASGEFYIPHWISGRVHDIDISALSYYTGSDEGFVALQQHWFPEYYQTALEERFQIAVGLVASNRVRAFQSRPSLFRLALSHNCIPKLAVHMRDRDGRTLLHFVALVIGSIAVYLGRFNYEPRDTLEDWRLVLRDLISLGADLHPVDQKSRTPFMHVLIGYSEQWILPLETPFPEDWGLYHWLSLLESCGVDLYEYGQREEELHERGLVRKEIAFIYRRAFLARVKLASFTYGRSPSEWGIESDWKYLDRDQDSGQDSGQVEKMPGGWIED